MTQNGSFRTRSFLTISGTGAEKELFVGGRVDEHVDRTVGVGKPHGSELDSRQRVKLANKSKVCCVLVVRIAGLSTVEQSCDRRVANWTPEGGLKDLTRICVRVVTA